MSAERYIKQAIIAALCQHPDQDKYKSRAFAGDNLQNMLDILAGKSNELTKADFFQPDDDGKILIDCAGFWRNFDKISALLDKKGEHFCLSDFVKSLTANEDGRTLLESAQEHAGLTKLFAPSVWMGRFDEMESLWFTVPDTIRRMQTKDSQINLDVKRSMLAFEGREMPEDTLIAVGLKTTDITKMNNLQHYQEVKGKFAAKGEVLKKEHILLRDNEGDTMFYTEQAWDLYPVIAADLAKIGQRFEIDDLIRHVGRHSNLITRASERKRVHLIFTPEHWVDRLDDMLCLWNYVMPGWKNGLLAGKEFDLAYATAESLTYGSLITADQITSAQDLLTPVNAGIDGQKPILPLGLKSVWENIDKINKSIKASEGRALTLDDLRQKSGGLDYTALMLAVKFGQFDKVVEIARQSGQALTVDDFLAEDKHGNKLLGLLAERNELKQVFTPEIWAGRVNDMKQLWSTVRVSDQSQVDFQQVEVAVKQATLKQHSKPKFKF